MLKIYGCYRSRASRNIWLANELGVAFEMVPVIQGYRLADPSAAGAPLNTTSPAFLRINPNGHIPSVDDDGLILHESLAINLHLAAKHAGPLAPADLGEAAQCLMWSFWAATEVETTALQLLYALTGKPEQRDAALAASCIEKLRKPFAVLDRHLSATGNIVANRFTVADINVAEVLRYAMPGTALFDASPRVKTWLAACQARPAFKAMWAKREAEPA